MVINCPSQLLTKDIDKNTGVFPVYDASGKPYKYIDFYQQETDCISIIKYGSGCGRTFLTSGKHSVLGTMTELKPINVNPTFIYAFTKSKIFKRTVKKYTEIGTTPNLYFSDYSKTCIPLDAINNKEKIVGAINSLELKETLLKQELYYLNDLKRFFLEKLFI